MVDTVESDCPRTLDSLPIEILCLIFKQLDANFLAKSVRLVCKRFCSALSDDILWKEIYMQQIQKHLSTETDLKSFFDLYELNRVGWKCSALNVEWADLAMEFGNDMHQWNKPENQIPTYVKKSPPHFGLIDTIHMLKSAKYCVSGGKDKMVALWDLHNPHDIKCVSHVGNGHNGWVYAFDSYDDNGFFSGSWDRSVCSWAVTNSGIEMIGSYNCGRPVMSVCCRKDLVIASVQSHLAVIDPRITKCQKILNLTVHRGIIIGAALLGNHIFSISEDKTMVVHDLRQNKCIKSETVTNDGCFPSSVKVKGNLVYVGDSKGSIHIFDALQNYKEVQTVALPNPTYINSVWPRLSSIFTGSKDCFMRIVVPAKQGAVAKEIKFSGEVTAVECKKNILAVAANGNITLMIGEDIKY